MCRNLMVVFYEQNRYPPALFPRPLRHASIAVLHAVVKVERGHRSQRFVIQTGLPESFFQVLLEVVKGPEVFGERRFRSTGSGAEEFLISAIDQTSDLAVLKKPGAFGYVQVTRLRGDVDGAGSTCDPVAPAGCLRNREPVSLKLVQPLLGAGNPGTFSAKEHS